MILKKLSLAAAFANHTNGCITSYGTIDPPRGVGIAAAPYPN